MRLFCRCCLRKKRWNKTWWITPSTMNTMWKNSKQLSDMYENEILSVAALTQLQFTISDQLENVAQRTFSATTSAPWRAYCPQSDIFKEVGPDHCALWEKVKYRTGWIRTFFLYPKSFISPWGDTVVFVSLLVVILTPARRVSPRDFRKLIISTTKMMLSRVGSGKMIFFSLDKSWCRSFAAAMLLLL